MAFITTAFNCEPDPIKPPHPSPLSQELQGRYQSDDGYVRLTLDANRRYILNLGGLTERGNYRINEFSHIELNLMDGSISFEIQRDPNGQIVRLGEALNGDPVLHRMLQEEHFISYDNLDMEIIRQNLGGRYRGTSNGQHMILELDNVHNTYYMDRDGQIYFGDYTIERTTYGILLVLHLENESETYYLHSIENSIERITSFNVGIQEGLHREAPPLQVSEFHTYTIGETDQVRQNLIGRYQGTLNNEVAVFDIRTNTMDITINGVTTTSDYLTSFFADSHPSLIFERDKVVFNYQIVFTPNSYTEIIGLRSTTPNLPASYFHKVENNANEIPPLQAAPIHTTPLSIIDDLPTYEELFPDITGSYVGFLGYNRVRLNLTYTTNSYELLTSTDQSSGIIRFERSSDQSYIRFQDGLLHGELFSINPDSNLIRIGHNTIFTKE